MCHRKQDEETNNTTTTYTVLIHDNETRCHVEKDVQPPDYQPRALPQPKHLLVPHERQRSKKNGFLRRPTRAETFVVVLTAVCRKLH